MKLVSKIRMSPDENGPFYVVTENTGEVSNMTTGVATLEAAIDQAQADQAAVIAGNLHEVMLITFTDA